jgi:DNA-binding response OmpR family regulator
MKGAKARILLVEDDPNLGFILKDYLEMLGYFVDLQRNGNDGYQSFRLNQYHLVILDVMLPFKDGFTLAEEIRSSDSFIPIIFLTARQMKEDKIKGFHLGADDFITKPFSSEELSLRIDAILRRIRYQGELAEDTFEYQIGSYHFNYSNQILTIGKETRRLTKKEADVLRLLCLNRNKLVKREKLLKHVWGKDDYFIGRSLDVYITRLRKYLNEDPGVIITNVHGTGYKLEYAEPETESGNGG